MHRDGIQEGQVSSIAICMNTQETLLATCNSVTVADIAGVIVESLLLLDSIALKRSGMRCAKHAAPDEWKSEKIFTTPPNPNTNRTKP